MCGCITSSSGSVNVILSFLLGATGSLGLPRTSNPKRPTYTSLPRVLAHRKDYVDEFFIVCRIILYRVDREARDYV